MRRSTGLAAILLVVVGCATGRLEPAVEPTPERTSLDSIAEIYVKLVLAVGLHDEDYVDAYYGPPEWREGAERDAATLPEIAERARSLIADLEAVPEGEHDDELVVLRRRYLATQLGSLSVRVEMLSGASFAFDAESKALYDAVAPTHPESRFRELIAELDPLLPGEGDLVRRFTEFRKHFVIPPDRLESVFSAAIDECRRRTQRHLELPGNESFEVEYVSDKSWSAYNWYQGNFHSLIQVNTDLPVQIDRAVDLACHEGYPGHHVYNMLLERHLVRDRGWVEYSVYALFSPQSLIAEGTANYGIRLTFPGDARVALDKTEQLAYAGNEAARRYLDGEIDAAAAAEWLTRFSLSEPDRAEQRVRFFDQYRSYVINYNLGQDLVRQYVERESGGGETDRLWAEFGRLLSSPRLPSGL
jgi:hypothetical protein